jgi:hypothetical protein
MFKSLGCVSQFDCGDVKRDLGWQPVADRAEFVKLGFRTHARGG